MFHIMKNHIWKCAFVLFLSMLEENVWMIFNNIWLLLIFIGLQSTVTFRLNVYLNTISYTFLHIIYPLKVKKNIASIFHI